MAGDLQLPQGWTIQSIGALGRVVTGKTPSTKIPNNFGGDIPFITPSDMDGRRIISHTARYLTDNGAASVSSSRIPAGAVMVSCIGSDMGKAAIAGCDAITNQQINSIIIREGVSSLYVYYYLSTRQREIQHLGSGGSAVPILNKGHFCQLQIVLPPIKEQQAIACILGALDDKIELNRKMNRTLEEMARAIFKSWFVDFDPVRAKAAGQQPPGLKPEIAALFPDTFEPSELGEIPKGWRVGVVGDIAKQAIGGQWGSDNTGDGLVPAICLRGCDIEDLRSVGYAPSAPVRFVKPNAIDARLPTDADVLIAASGAGPCGRPLWCSSSLHGLYEAPVIYSNFVKRLTTPSPAHAIYLDRMLIRKFEDRTIHDYINGTSVPNLDATGLLSGCPVLIPSDGVLRAYSAYCQPMFSRLYSKVNVTLARLRDALLPKLISGELRVPDAERFLKERGL